LYDGFYDGITGLVTQPRYGYQENGAKGMAKGIGKGIGGVFFKPPAGLCIFAVIISQWNANFLSRTLGPRRLSLEWGPKNAVDFIRKIPRRSDIVITDLPGPR
jgi:hypothetical protein